MASSCKRLTKDQVGHFLDQFDTIIFDCDGVLWHPCTGQISGASETVDKIRNMGKQPIFVTNNGAKSRSNLKERFTRFGFEVEEDEIFSAAYCAALYLKAKVEFSGKLYMIGSPGLEEEMKNQGIKYIGPGPDVVDSKFFEHRADHIDLDPEVTGVAIGFDPYYNYMKLLKATSYLSNPDVTVFIGTNGDPRLPMNGTNIVMPGTGSLIRTVEVASKRKATVLGKPTQFVLECIQEKFNVDPARTLMIGDSLRSDVLLGKNCGFTTLAVLTGVTSEEDIFKLEESEKDEERKMIPDYYIESVGHLGDFIASMPC